MRNMLTVALVAVTIPVFPAQNQSLVPVGVWNELSAFGRKLDLRNEDAAELPETDANGWTYGAGTYPKRLEAVGESLVRSADLYAQATQSLAHALGRLDAGSVPTPFGVKALMGRDFGWNPKSYLENHLRFVRLTSVCNRAMGRIFALHGICLEVGGDARAYLNRVKPGRLRELREALRALDAVISEEEKSGRFTRRDAFSRERFGEIFREIHNSLLLSSAR